jgi:hypothetical protein
MVARGNMFRLRRTIVESPQTERRRAGLNPLPAGAPSWRDPLTERPVVRLAPRTVGGDAGPTRRPRTGSRRTSRRPGPRSNVRLPTTRRSVPKQDMDGDRDRQHQEAGDDGEHVVDPAEHESLRLGAGRERDIHGDQERESDGRDDSARVGGRGAQPQHRWGRLGPSDHDAFTTSVPSMLARCPGIEHQ